jgi:PAS domain S-box-containing protein
MATIMRDELLEELVSLCRRIGEETQIEKSSETRIEAHAPSAEEVRSAVDVEEIQNITEGSPLFKKLIPALLKIALMTCIFFSIYEITKQILFTNIIIWQSHVITIIFASMVAALGAYFPLRRIEILYERSMHELAARKRAQEILRESEERYRQLFEMESDAVFLIDDETDQILEVNAAGARLYGFDREELLVMRSSELIHQIAETPEKGDAELQRAVSFHRKKDGCIFPVEIAISHVTWWGKRVRLSAIRDVTEHVNAQKKRERHRAFLRKVIDANPNLIYVKDRENRILLVNRILAETFRMTPEQMIGKTFTDLLTSSELAKIIQRDDLSILNNQKERIEREESFTDSSGNTRWTFTIKVPMKDADGNTEHLIGVSTDITERKHAEEVLKKRETELEIKSRNLEEVNTALKVLLKQREEDKKEIEELFLSNVKEQVIPYVEKMKITSLDAEQKVCLETLEMHLNDIISPFVNKITAKFINLTPKEIQVASLIKDGKTTKEIAALLNISPGSVDLHRNHIRNKLGISNQNVNLHSYLLSLP